MVLGPHIEELDTLSQLLSGFGGDEAYEPSKLIADGVALLPGQNKSCVGCACFDPACMYSTEVRHIEAVQSPSLLRGEPQLSFVRMPDHSGIPNRKCIDATQAQGIDKVCIHRVLVNIEADSAHEGGPGLPP